MLVRLRSVFASGTSPAARGGDSAVEESQGASNLWSVLEVCDCMGLQEEADIREKYARLMLQKANLEVWRSIGALAQSMVYVQAEVAALQDVVGSPGCSNLVETAALKVELEEERRLRKLEQQQIENLLK